MGCGARRKLPETVRAFGHRILVVTDPGMAKEPLFQECLSLLKDGGLHVAAFTGVSPEPRVTSLQPCVDLARDCQADVLVGIGGGSSLDVTKCVAVLLRYPREPSLLFGIDKVPGRGVPTVVLPTTAGSGSEVTPIAVMSDEKRKIKLGIVSDHLIADVALVDPELCVSLPPWPTAYTGMDAMTHAIEVYTNRFAVPFIDNLAIEAVRLVGLNLRRCVARGNDVTARYGMSLASLLGGLCLKSVNTAAVHALAYPLGCEFNVPHGIANALLLPHVMRFNASACQERYKPIAEALGANDAVLAVEELSQEVGTARKLREFDVREGDLPRMAKSAMAVERLLKNNPREVTEADALNVYKAAW